eukprot:CAMPEP_0197001432 /NCGR_PEP_ID=MMETSP1380-20130617/6133_1 /TAXON_ID=5936 /ORGANISM="Euplotes crassus, Strain CT5" /LENGTH=435 /DNA_ID=CAMNT_0042419099 /DNA_START=723 /DNA_END=2027 /DNA_ORIENTATION=-
MKRNKLKAELLFTKLNSVFAKRADRDKFAGFNLMRNLISKSSKIEYSKGNYKNFQSTNPNSHEESKVENNRQISNASIWSKVHGMRSSLIEDMIRREQSNLEKLYPNFDYDSPDSLDSDPETNELDDYLTRRLEKIEKSKSCKHTRRANFESKRSDPPLKSKTTSKIVIGEDTEYEYVLESADEGESESEYYESDDTPVDRIFSNSFLHQSKNQTLGKELMKNEGPNTVQKKKSLKQRLSPSDYQKFERKTSNIKKTDKFVDIEEVKEDGYFQSILDKSEVFSNISAICDYPNSNNLKNVITYNPNHGISFEEEVDLDKEIKNLNLEEFESEYTDTNDGDSGVFGFQKNSKVMKKDMNKIAQDLEKIRDIVMRNGDRKEGEGAEDEEDEGDKEYDLDDEEYRMVEGEICEGEESEEDDSNLPEYNSREISDFITE